ncbi:hypothetical protein KA183_14680 [bacterium]|nr:hypothetical protein [bacterium]QQR57984.1 MAG: hypothetical protein IPG59_00415 [Candidatus Melainabacteria bacterium]
MSDSPNLNDQKQDKSTIYVALSTLALGVLVVFYMQVLSKVSQIQIKEDPLDQTAKLVSQRLSAEKIHSQTFGDLTMTDLDELKAAIKNAYIFAQSTNQASALDKLVLLDLDELHELEIALAQKMQQEINENGGIAKFAIDQFKLRLPAQSHLYSLKISFGSGKEKDPNVSSIKTAKSEQQSPFCQSGYYKTNFPVELKTASGERQLFFHKHYDKTEIFEPDQFVYVTPDVVPSSILIEAVIEQSDNTKATRRIIKQTCATIALSDSKKARLCFAFRFPQGVWQTLKPIDFLDANTWVKNGEWYQATNGPVPGRGNLGPAINTSLNNQNPAQAIVVALYHWMRQNHSRENIDPDKLKNLLSAQIKPAPINQLQKAQVNSCLLTDALLPLKKDSTKQEWQKGLYDLFEYQEKLQELPGDAFPIIIDSNGTANIAGRNTYDQKLVSDYLDSLYKTNLAALETLEISRLVMGNTAARLNNLKMELLQKEQEFKALSLKSALNKDLQVRLENIESIIKIDKENYYQLEQQFKVAKLVSRNAQIAILRTFDLASHNLNTCRSGLHRIDNQPLKFLLSRKEVFHSCEYPLSDQNLIESSKNRKISQLDGGRWLEPDFNVLASWQTLNSNDKIDQKPLDMVLAEEEIISCPKAVTLILDSEGLYTSYQSPYVFAGLPVSEDQLFYYAPLSLSKEKNVFWSASVRDLVCRSKPNQPLQSRSQAQFVKADFAPSLNLTEGSYPLMAGEFQLRRPIVKDLQNLAGIVLRDSSWKKESPIIPPIPLDML